MARRPALRALAERAGILSSYRSAGSDRLRRTSDATRVALLAALGRDAGTEAAARRALAAWDEAERARPIAPFRMVRRGERGGLAVRGARGMHFDLTIRREDGERVERSGRLASAARIALPPLPLGAHELRLRLHGPGGDVEAYQVLAVVPQRCVAPAGRRAFGLWTNLYALRRRGGLGFGDLTALRELVAFAGAAGAAFVGINPLHALRNRPPEVSPYAPVSRLFRNPLYLDVEAVPELAGCAEAQRLLSGSGRELAALRGAERIDYARVAALQRPILEALHRCARGRRARGRAAASRDELLRDFATFAALEDWLAEQGHARDWRAWPADYRDPRSPAVGAFREARREAVDFHVFVQLELDRQLAAAAADARAAGLSIGLYQDLAIGSAASGFDTWAFPGLFVAGASLGAPPDPLAPQGQDWGFPPLDPQRLRDDGYRYWRRLLRACCAHAGAVRIDHVLGLFRQFWIPAGRPSASGAYVRFPLRELLGLLALESRRHGALVIGEDLGTVPRGLPAALARAGVLSSRVLRFERDRRGAFRPARSYSRRALVTAGTHDLPTLAGFWTARDLEIRRALGALPGRAFDAARREREVERGALLGRLRRDGLLPPGPGLPAPTDLCAAVHAFLCRTPSPLVGVSLDDLAGEVEPVNVPGFSAEQYPSWTRRMSRDVAELARAPDVERGLSGTRVRALRRRT